MRILFCGDVMGKAGRRVLRDYLPELKEKLKIDLTVVNIENAAHGFGATPKNYAFFQSIGIDVMTLGNHSFDKKEIIPLLDDSVIVRPINYPEGTPGNGFYLITLKDGRKALITQIVGRLFMRASENPFLALDKLLEKYKLGENVQAILVDLHAEATSEKMALGNYLDGRVSIAAGTHTHVPTGDMHILKNGTAYMTDVGMCGNYDSVIGMTAQTAMPRFFNHPPFKALEPQEADGATLCGIYVETDDKTGKALKIRPIRLGGYLQETDLDLL